MGSGVWRVSNEPGTGVKLRSPSLGLFAIHQVGKRDVNLNKYNYENAKRRIN
jgi:hypothetical protein